MQKYELLKKYSYCYKCEKIKKINHFITNGEIFDCCKECGYESDTRITKNIFLANLNDLKYKLGKKYLKNEKEEREFFEFYVICEDIELEEYEVLDLYNSYNSMNVNLLDKIQALHSLKTQRGRSFNKEYYNLKVEVRSESNECYYCGLTNCHSIDHLVPLSKGGSDTKDNMAISCVLCNTLKGSYLPEIYINFYNKHKHIFDKRVDLINKYKDVESKQNDIKSKLKKRNQELLEQNKYPSKDEQARVYNSILQNYVKEIDNIQNDIDEVIQMIKDNFTFFKKYDML